MDELNYPEIDDKGVINCLNVRSRAGCFVF